MQTSLDAYLKAYNTERAHQGRGMQGRTPRQAFIDGIPRPETAKETPNRKQRTRTEPKAA